MIKKLYSIFNLKLYIHPKKLYSSLFTAFCKSTPFLAKTKKKTTTDALHMFQRGQTRQSKGGRNSWLEMLSLIWEMHHWAIISCHKS